MDVEERLFEEAQQSNADADQPRPIELKDITDDVHQEIGVVQRPEDLQDAPKASSGINKLGLWSLGAQHLSSTWSDRTAEFAFYLYLIEIYKTTLIPASLFGFFTTGVCVVASGPVGSLVDRVPKLVFVRWCIALQKLSAGVAYACFFAMFATRLHNETSESAPVTWALFALIVLAGCVLKISTTGISVAIERDWAMCIADGQDERLTVLNTVLRRIDLVCKLVAPLFVSLLTTAASYTFSVAFLLGFGIVTMVFELVWVQIIYRRFSSLEAEQRRKDAERFSVLQAASTELSATAAPGDTYQKSLTSILRRTKRWVKSEAADWHEFIKHPVFGSSMSISLLYLTVLSFDGTMLSWLKTHNFSDPFVAGMRSICVAAGLIGTFVAPLLERRIGVVRAGSWALWSQVLSLIPVLLSFYVGAPKDGMRSSSWNATLLFGGMAFSRIGLWAFDLCQLKELQMALADHPRRNTMTGLQYSMQNIADLLKYALTLVFSQPSQFRWAALISFTSVCGGALSYVAFLKRMRGHVVHLEWIEGLLGKVKAS